MHSCGDARLAARYLDAREGDSGGGIGANHQGDECGAEVPEHVGKLKTRRQLSVDSFFTFSQVSLSKG